APDLQDTEVRDLATALIAAQIDGVIATNTTLDRERVKGQKHAEQAGGLSGSVLSDKSQHITALLCKELKGCMPVIGVGGIDGADTAKMRIEGGTPLIQIYSSLIYKGPKVIKEIVNSL
ncbi:MAG: dihydroorotate dehydrogenase, partial [Paraglaciecola sp.]